MQIGWDAIAKRSGLGLSSSDHDLVNEAKDRAEDVEELRVPAALHQ